MYAIHIPWPVSYYSWSFRLSAALNLGGGLLYLLHSIDSSFDMYYFLTLSIPILIHGGLIGP